MDKYFRKLTRFTIQVVDVVTALLLLVFLLLDWRGYLSSIFPSVSPRSLTNGIFLLFVITHFAQRLFFEAHRPALLIRQHGWETIKTRDYERLFVKVENLPIINSPNNNSIATGARIFFINKETKVIEFEFENVRWQGTPPAQAIGHEYQPYDNWVVTIESGRSRLLYFAHRVKSSNKELPVYVHNDAVYDGDAWTNKKLKLTQREYYVCVVLWSSNFDPKPFWFHFDSQELKPIKLIRNVEVLHE
jgi:hypothetical protein